MCLDSGDYHQLEIEWKLDLVSRENFSAILDLLGQRGRHLKSLSQINYYLDTSDGSLLEAQEMLRLRWENDSWVLTHKSQAKNEGGLQSSREQEWSAPTDLCEENLLAWVREQEFFPLREPVLLGALHNQREVFVLDEFTLELDAIRFQNKEGYCLHWELELETSRPQKAKKLLESLLEAAGIPFLPQTRSKFRRFLEFTRQ